MGFVPQMGRGAIRLLPLKVALMHNRTQLFGASNIFFTYSQLVKVFFSKKRLLAQEHLTVRDAPIHAGAGNCWPSRAPGPESPSRTGQPATVPAPSPARFLRRKRSRLLR